MDKNPLMLSEKYGDFYREFLFPGEETYFLENPDVAGMASDDGKVVLNPFSNLSDDEKDSVFKNELSRLFMRGQIPGSYFGSPFRPNFDITQQQSKMLSGTTYGQAPLQDRRETIAARMLSGDPSAGSPTGDQYAFMKALSKTLFGVK